MKTFLLLHDFGDIFNMLTDSEAGEIIKAVFAYEKNGTEPEFTDRAMQMAFFNIRRFLDSNRENYEKVCKQRSEYAKKRWEKISLAEKEPQQKGMHKDAQACLSMHKHTAVGNTDVNTNADVNAKSKSKSDVNVNDNVSVNVKSDDNVNVNDKADTDAFSEKKLTDTHTHKKCYGEFNNVFLTDDEYDLVKNRMSEGERRLQSLSAYMKATGKNYNDHYARLINWNFYSTPGSPVSSKADGASARVKPPGERREPTFDVSEFTKKAVGIKYVPPADD